MENYSTYRDAISEAEKAEGTAARKMEAYNESIAYSINQLSAAWEGFTQKLEASGAVKLFFQLLTVSVEKFGTILSQVLSTVVSLRSFKLTTDLKRLADFFGFSSSEGKGRLRTKWDKTKAWLDPNRMTQQAAQEKEKYEQQRAGTYEEQSRNKVVNSNNRVVDALNRNVAALDRNSAAQRGENAPQPGDKTPNKTSEAKATPAAEIQGEQQQSDISRNWLLGLTGSTVSGAGYFAAKKARKNIPLLEQQIKDLEATGDFSESTPRGLANTWELQELKDQLEKNQNTLKSRGVRVQELKANWKQNAIRGVGTGLTAGIMSGLTAEGDVQDKFVIGASSAVATGLLSAIPGVGTILGPILGPILGEFFGKEINKLLKADEVARKERVEQAKENLEAIKGVSTSVTGLIDIRKKGDTSLWDSDDWKQANEYVESIIDVREANAGFTKAMDDAVAGTKDFVWTLENLVKDQQTLANVEAARIKYEAEQTYAAGEQDRYALLKEIEDAQKKLISGDKDEKEKAEATIKANRAAIKEYTDELNKAYMKSAFYSSGVSTMSQAQKNTASLERLIVEMAEEAEKAAEGKTDEKFFEDDGTLKSEYRNKFIQQIREQGGYETVLTESEKSVADYKKAMNTVANITDKTGNKLNMKLSDLKKLVSSKGGIAELGEMLGITGDQLNGIVDQINSADDSKITTIAHSLNMTVEEFNEANKNGDFDFFTTGMAVENLDAFIDRIDKLNGYLAELATNGKLSAESLENVVKNYAFLMQGANGSFGAENILENLAELYAEGSESTIAQALAGKFQKKAVTDETWWNAWTQSVPGKEFIERDSLNTTFTSFSDAMSSMTKEERQSYIDYVKSLFTTDLGEEIQEKRIEWQTKAYETEISNLESIRDALDDVNKQREKELELIKAKEALENASKEKKRVYREGVGFVYTTDQEAVKSAQEKVDELERQQDKDNIQYQIDSLQRQKEILENLENNEQLENLTTFVEKIQKALGEDGENLFSSILTENGTFQTNMIETIADGIIRSAEKVKEQENLEATREAAKKYVKAGQEYDEFMENNKGILEDKDNPAYNDTYAKWLEKANALINARSAYNDASAIKPIEDTSDIKSEWENINSNIYSGKTASLLNVLDDSVRISRISDFNWHNINKAAVGADIFISEESPVASGQEFEKQMIGKNRSVNDRYIIGRYDTDSKSWQFYSTNNQIDNFKSQLKPYDILINDWWFPFYNDRAVFVDADKKFRWVNADSGKIYSEGWVEKLGASEGLPENASGTLSAPGGRALINENGLESIITPQGTITSLPAKTGIVPADLTRNLWALGEVAPNLIARLGGNSLQTNNSNSATDNSININNLDATFYTEEGFDGEAFLRDLKSQVILTSNNH